MKNTWRQIVRKYKNVYIFGATKSALDTTILFEMEHPVKVKGYIVSNTINNPCVFKGKRVYGISELDNEVKENDLVVVSQSWRQADSIITMLKQEGFRNVFPNPYRFKMGLDDFEKQEVNELWNRKKHLDNSISLTKYTDKSCMIYAVTSHDNRHKSTDTYNSKYINYIQSGAALTDIRICNLADDIGENVSRNNPFLSELSAGYWVAHNDCTHDYLGLFHYSRGLDIDDDIIESILCRDIDLVLPEPIKIRYEVTSSFFNQVDFNYLVRGLQMCYPEYEQTANIYLNNRYMSIANMLIAKADLYKAYYKWLFDVLKVCEQLYKNDFNELRDRMWGYYAEHLLNIYFLYHSKEISIEYYPIREMWE